MDLNFLNFKLVYFQTLNFFVLFVQPNDDIYKNYDCESVCESYFSQKVVYDKLVLVEPKSDFLKFVEMAVSDVVFLEIEQFNENED